MGQLVDLKRLVLAGTLWTTLGEGLAAGISLATGIAAARILEPRDIGLMGLVAVTIGAIDSFTRSGFEQALIQRAHPVEHLLDAAWTWQALRGLLLTVAIFALAPVLASLYSEPALTPLLWVGALQSVVQGLQNVGTLRLVRELNFRAQFLLRAAPALVNLLVVIPAILILRNVWALILGYVVGAAAQSAVSYVLRPHRPRLDFNRAQFSELFRYGKWITGMALIGFCVTQADDLFVGAYLGASALGFYQLAYNISNLPATHVTHVLSRVTFSTYARVQHDDQLLIGAFRDVTRLTMLIAGPLCAAIWLLSPALVEYVIGPKWEPILPLVRILAVAGLVRAFAALAGPLFQAVGRPDLDLKMNLPRLVITLGLIWPACAYAGVAGAAYVILFGIISTMPIWFYGVRLLLRITPLDVARWTAPGLLCTALTAALLSAVRP